MDQPDWAKIVSYAHENNGQILVQPDIPEEEEKSPWQQPEDGIQEFHEEVRRAVDLENPSDKAISEARQHLSSRGIVKFVNSKYEAGIELTQTGFNVAHERELSVRNSQINESLSLFTLVLVVITGIDVVPFEEPVKAALVGGILIALLVYLRQAESFAE